MKPARKAVRRILKQSTKAEFEEFIDGANLTPMQDKIIRLHIVKDWTICKIALSLSWSESNVRKILTATYDKLSKY